MVKTSKANAFDGTDTIAAKIPVSEMVVYEYQGHVIQSLVEKIAKNWDESAAGAVVLNLRDDNTYAVLDGQHRYLAAKKRGEKDLNALVFIGKTPKEEARLFVQLNTKHNVTAMDRFRANLFSGHTMENNIRTILREVGLEIGTHGPDRAGRAVQCPSILVRIYEAHGPSHLRIVAGVLTSAFDGYPDRAKGYSGPSWMATSQFIFRYPEAEIARLIAKLKEKAPTVIQGMADMQTNPNQDVWMGWGKAITGLYNHGFRSTFRGYLPPTRWEQKKFSPTAKASIKVKTSRVASLAKARAAQQASRVPKLQAAAKSSK